MRFKKNLISFWTLLHREVVRVIRIWPQTLLPSAITMSLYFIIFGDIIGRRIGTMDGIPYINYIVPGLVMMAIITNSYTNVASSFFSSKFQRNIEEMLIAPMPASIILLGYVLGGVIRGFIIGVIVICVSLFFSQIHIYSWSITLLIAILTAMLFSLAGFVNGILAKKFDDVSLVPTFILTPLTYLGGVFYSVSLLPTFWQIATHFNPVFYMVNGFRFGMLGESDVSIQISLYILIIGVLALYLISLQLLKRGIGVKP